MLDQNLKIKNDNFSRLSLSQSKKTSHSNSSQKYIYKDTPQKCLLINDLSLEKKIGLNIKNISQLIIQNSIIKDTENGNAIDSTTNSKCNNVCNQNLDKDKDIIITLSSDDEVFQAENKLKKTKKKRNKSKLKTTEKEKDIKTEKTPTKKRKLTKSSNLKTFSAKDHPDNQTKLENFFTITSNPETIKYFDTFEKSNKPQSHETETNNDLDFLESILVDIENGAAINLKSLEAQIQNTDDSKFINSENVSTHFQCKKKIINNSENISKIANYIETNFMFPGNIEDKLLKKGINSESPNLLVAKTMSSTKDCDSKIDFAESIVFHYNSVPSVKTESVIYSLAESANVCRRSSRLNSQSTTNHSEDFAINNKKLVDQKVRKRLLFNTSSIIKTVHSKEDTKASSTLIKSPHLLISSLGESCVITKNTNSTVSNNTSNSACNIEQYKYNSYNCPITIEDNECKYSTPIQLLKSTTKIRATKKKRNYNKSPVPETDGNQLNNRRKRVLQCPSYKVIEETTFAVDGFRFGEIEGVTHYFLTHFHGDHYIGLRKNFSMPIYMSEITATLVSNFIHVSPDFIHIINPTETKIIKGIEVTSIDANHCPGAVMFAFKLPNGKCILHTGDFRACPEMESESYFWNNNIHTIYLDTTYLHKNYDFKPQTESISDVRYYIEEFCEKHIGQRILLVCGSYVIGKEKVWAEIAKITGYRVYTNGNRRKALTAIADPNLLNHLIDDPKEANIHVVTMNQVNYLKLFDYFKLYSDHFDVLLGIRPSGWEKNTKPQFGGIINILGIEYSEHSSYSELRRFCRFLQPKSIISTVPVNNELSITAKIPKSWINCDVQPRQQAYQPSICSYISTMAKKRSTDDQQSTCSKYLKQNDHCSVTGMLDATKSSLDLNSPTKSKLAIKEFKGDESIARLSEPIEDWMS